MSEMGHTFAGSMPEFYDRFLVPFMFAPFACDMAARLSGLVSGHLLELAAGTGAMTHALAATLPSGVRITATDLNPAMLVQAQTHAGSQRIAWQEADAQALPFAEQMFDAVLCQFGVMFFSWLIMKLRPCRRYLVHCSSLLQQLRRIGQAHVRARCRACGR
jgi:ubiquinone/menaquinone biosynthesis C-methylase UbiE